jgi:hypothetical protein
MNLIKNIFLLLSIQSTLAAYGQINYTPSKNEVNIYYTVVDTLISKVKAKEGDVKIVLAGDEFILKMLPDTIKSIPLSKERPYKSKRKYEGAIWIQIDELSVVKEDKVNVFTTISRQIHKHWIAWEMEEQISSYLLVFKHDKTLNSYNLIEIQTGFFIR